MSLTPPDIKRCQADVPTAGPFGLGSPSGNPKNGYRVRCANVPTVVAVENKPGKDGEFGSMSLCDNCKSMMIKQLGPTFASFEKIGEGA